MCVFSRLYVQWVFMRGIEAQFLALQKGFHEIIPQHLLRPFDERELDVCIPSLSFQLLSFKLFLKKFSYNNYYMKFC